MLSFIALLLFLQSTQVAFIIGQCAQVTFFKDDIHSFFFFLSK